MSLCRSRLAAAATSISLAWVLSAPPVWAQQPDSGRPDYSRAPSAFPAFYKPYLPQRVPPPDLKNSARLSAMMGAGKVQLTIRDVLAAALENSLEVVLGRYALSMAETDILRASAGQAPRGIEGASVPSGLFAGAIGAGLGGGGGGGGGLGGGGGISGNARSVTLRPSGSFDPSFSLNFSVDRNTNPLNTIRVSGVPVVRGSTVFLQTSYQQAFPTGTTLAVSFSNQRQSSSQQSLLYNPSIVSRYNVSITQNLTNGLGFAVNKRFLAVAESNQRAARELFRQRLTTVIVQAQNLYWDLAAGRQNVRNAEQALQVTERLYQDNKARVESGTLAPVDLFVAEAELASRRRDLVIAQAEAQNRELQLKGALIREWTPEMAAASIETAEALPDPSLAVLTDAGHARAEAEKNRPELRLADEDIRKQTVVVNFTRDSLKPSLVVFGLVASAGLAGNSSIPNPSGGPPIVIPSGLLRAFGQVGRLDYPEYAVGFTLNLPLRNRSAQADHVRAQLDAQQGEVELQQIRMQIALEVRRALMGVEQTKARAQAAAKAAELSRRAVDAEQRKLEVGVNTLYDVIRTQRDLLSAQRIEVQTRASFAKALVELARATGTALEQGGVDFDSILRGTP